MSVAAHLVRERRQKRRVARLRDEPPGGQVGVAYSWTPAVTGGKAPYVVTLNAGALPDGLALASSAISGTPTQGGSFKTWLKVTDAELVSSYKQVEFAIAGA